MQLISLFLPFLFLRSRRRFPRLRPKITTLERWRRWQQSKGGRTTFRGSFVEGANKPKYARNEGDSGGTFLEGGCSVTDWSERKLSPTFSSSFAAAD